MYWAYPGTWRYFLYNLKTAPKLIYSRSFPESFKKKKKMKVVLAAKKYLLKL